MTDINQVEIEKARLEAYDWIASFELDRDTLTKQHTDAFKWMNGSLFAINGGGVIATLNSESIEINSRIWAGSFFIAGLLIMILVGVVSQNYIDRILPHKQNSIKYWRSVSVDGKREAILEEKLQCDTEKVEKGRCLTAALGWVSAIFFLCGAINLMMGLQASASKAETADV
jgi:hypothetical protein